MTQIELAAVLGISQTAVSACVRRGMPTTSGDDALAWRAAHMRRTHTPRLRLDRAAGASAATAPAAVAGSSRALTQQLLAERLRRESAEAQMAERRAAEQAGTLVLASAVVDKLAQCLGPTRDALRGLGSRLAPLVAVEETTAGCARIVDAEVNATLADLAAALEKQFGAEVAE